MKLADTGVPLFAEEAVSQENYTLAIGGREIFKTETAS